MIALYTLHVGYQFSCRIPKVNGKGYLKSCFGGHSTNDACNKFYIEFGERRDTCDIDGYLSVDQRSLGLDEAKRKDAQRIMEALTKTFPRITEWKEQTVDEFFSGMM